MYHQNRCTTERLLEMREGANDDPEMIVKYHRIVARYIRMKAKHESILKAYVTLQKLVPMGLAR